MKSLIGTKVGMTQVCSGGAFCAVTVLHVGPCEVLAIRTPERDRYSALQLGYGLRPVNERRPRVGASSKKFVREVPFVGGIEVGAQLSVERFEGVPTVDVIGVSKGRGFAGVIKRHNFSGLCASHGVKKVHRSGGSTGQSTDPGRVFKGAKMPGRFGGVRVTVKALKVFSLVPAENLILVRGAVPGFAGGFIVVNEAV